MGRFTVDPAALQAVRSAITTCVDSSRDELTGLRSAAAELHWRGAAATDFDAGWRQWLHGIDGLLAALDELGVAVGLSGETYAGTETQVVAAVDGAPA